MSAKTCSTHWKWICFNDQTATSGHLFSATDKPLLLSPSSVLTQPPRQTFPKAAGLEANPGSTPRTGTRPPAHLTLLHSQLLTQVEKFSIAKSHIRPGLFARAQRQGRCPVRSLSLFLAQCTRPSRRQGEPTSFSQSTSSPDRPCGRADQGASTHPLLGFIIPVSQVTVPVRAN